MFPQIDRVTTAGSRALVHDLPFLEKRAEVIPVFGGSEFENFPLHWSVSVFTRLFTRLFTRGP